MWRPNFPVHMVLKDGWQGLLIAYRVSTPEVFRLDETIYYTLLYSTLLYYTVLYRTVLYSTILD